MEPVHLEAVTTEVPQEEIRHTSFNIVSRHNEDPHTFFGAITDPGNSVTNVATDMTSYKFVCSRMVYNGNGFKPATGAMISAGKRINGIVISSIPFMSKNPNEGDRMLSTLITVDLGMTINSEIPVRLHSQPGVGYYLSVRGDSEFDVTSLKAVMPHRLGYYSKLAARINASRYSLSSRYIEQLVNPNAKGYTLHRMHNDIGGIKHVIGFNESE